MNGKPYQGKLILPVYLTGKGDCRDNDMVSCSSGGLVTADLFSLLSGSPFGFQLAVFLSTVSQIKIDETLVRDAGLLRHAFEIINHVNTKSDCDILF